MAKKIEILFVAMLMFVSNVAFSATSVYSFISESNFINNKETIYVDDQRINIYGLSRQLKKDNDGKIENTYVLNMYYISCLDYLKDKEKFNIIFLDPPYNLDCLDDVLNKIVEYDLLEESGLVICEYEYVLIL